MEIEEKHYRKPFSWWEGKRVRVIKEIKTRGGDVFPVGEVMVVRGKRKGLALNSFRRKENGCGMGITQVSIEDLEFVKQQINEAGAKE